MIWARLWAHLSVRIHPCTSAPLAMHLVGEDSFGLGYLFDFRIYSLTVLITTVKSTIWWFKSRWGSGLMQSTILTFESFQGGV